MPKGSHGKTLYFHLKSVDIRNTVTNKLRFHNCNYVEKLGSLKSHDQSDIEKDDDYAARKVEETVILRDDEVVETIYWEHYTAK